MRKIKIVDMIVVFGLLAVVILALAPAVARVQRSYAEAKCQSNLKRLAGAISAYVADNRSFFTNRQFVTGTTTPKTVTLSHVQLSPLEYDANGEPVRFVNGITWVEALYPYITKTAKSRDQDWLSVFRCPNATSPTYPAKSPTARVTYVLNYNLLDMHARSIPDPAKLFMIREADRLVNSMCRPVTLSNGNYSVAPVYPFLNGQDPILASTGPVNPNLHGNGSYVLFVDGHVRHFTSDYFPPSQSYITNANCWDQQTIRWYNHGPGSGAQPPLLKSIAVSL